MKTPLRMATKDFRFEIKEVSDDTGTFTGMLSVYNVVDLGNDLVEPGAFKKTLNDKGAKFPMLWQHKTDEPIGELEVTDTEDGLSVKGTFDLEVVRAREAYSLVKKRIIKGLSIGYRAVQKKMEGGIRHLKEIELYEGSVVTFPMLPVAQISGVKAAEEGKDFLQALADAQTWMAHSMMMQSLDMALCDARWDSNMSRDDKLSEISDSIDQFKERYLSYLPDYFDLTGTKAVDDKAGRRISAASRTKIEEAITNLQALLEEAVDTAEETAAADTPEPKAATPSIEPVNDHSQMLESFRNRLREAVAA